MDFGKKISERLTGKKLSEEHKAKIVGTGRKHSEETKRKIGEANKGKILPPKPPMSEETKEKIRQARLGTKRSRKLVLK